MTDLAQRYLVVAGRRPGDNDRAGTPPAGRAGPAAWRYGPAAGRDGPAAGRSGSANEQASPATRASQVGSSGLGGRTRALRRLYNKVVGQVIDTKVDNKSRRCLKITIMHIKKKNSHNNFGRDHKDVLVSMESLYCRINVNYYII